MQFFNGTKFEDFIDKGEKKEDAAKAPGKTGKE